MRLLICFSLFLTHLGAALSVAQLEGVRRSCETRMAVNYTEPQINTAAQNLQAWIETNRGSLPNQITAGNLTAGQITAARAAIGGSLSNAQRAVLIDAVGALNEIVPAAPPDPVDATVLSAIRAQLLSLFSAQIDAAKPGVSNADKLRAIVRVLQ